MIAFVIISHARLLIIKEKNIAIIIYQHFFFFCVINVAGKLNIIRDFINIYFTRK